MPRFENPADVHFFQGQPVAGGKLFYFESGTSTPKTTFNDSAETTPNTNPVILDANGREPNIFYQGSAKVQLKTSSDELVWERDPVGSTSGSRSAFSVWDPDVIYDDSSLVTGSDGNFYESLTSSNLGNDPVTDGGVNWKEIAFFESIWAAGETYNIPDVRIGSDLKRYESVTDSNTGNDPVSDAGVNWKLIDFVNPLWATGATYNKNDITIASDDLRYQSVIDSNTGNDPTTDDGTNWERVEFNRDVLPKTGAVTLTPLRVNQIQDATTKTLPLASSVPANGHIEVEREDLFKAFAANIGISGGDLIEDADGTSATFQVPAGTSFFMRLRSNGSNRWTV